MGGFTEPSLIASSDGFPLLPKIWVLSNYILTGCRVVHERTEYPPLALRNKGRQKSKGMCTQGVTPREP